MSPCVYVYIQVSLYIILQSCVTLYKSHTLQGDRGTSPCPVSGRVFLSRVTCPVSRPRGAAASLNPHVEFHLTCTLAASSRAGAVLAPSLQCISPCLSSYRLFWKKCPVFLYFPPSNNFVKIARKCSLQGPPLPQLVGAGHKYGKYGKVVRCCCVMLGPARPLLHTDEVTPALSEENWSFCHFGQLVLRRLHAGAGSCRRIKVAKSTDTEAERVVL